MTQILTENLCFAEGPRWRDGYLWFSDMHAQQILKVDPDGKKEVVLKLDDDQPSGLGWLPNGDLLFVAMTSRQLRRFDGQKVHLHSDMSQLASGKLNDMVVSTKGYAYVGNFGFDLHGGEKPKQAELIICDPSGEASLADEDMSFPNGAVITPDNKTLIVAETFAQQITAFDIDADHGLSNKRLWCKLPEGSVPDGICLDAQQGIWSASPSSNKCIRQIEGGEVTHQIDTDRGAFACMLDDYRNLYILTSSSSDPEECKSLKSSRIEVHAAPFKRAGTP